MAFRLLAAVLHNLWARTSQKKKKSLIFVKRDEFDATCLTFLEWISKCFKRFHVKFMKNQFCPNFEFAEEVVGAC